MESLLKDKGLKPKARIDALAGMVLQGDTADRQWLKLADEANAVHKATLIAALELVTKTDPGIATVAQFNFVAEALADESPRVKSEAARVIGNTVHLFPGRIDLAMKNLLANTENAGTVVRWATAFALAQMIRTRHSKTLSLIPAIEAIAASEENNAVRKIYQQALRLVKTNNK